MSENDQFGQTTPDGISLFKEGRFAEAIPLLQARVSDNPLDTTSRAYLAACYSQTGNTTEAIAEFERLTSLEPNSAQHFGNLGMAYEGTGNLQKAKEAYRNALAVNPGYQKAQQRLAGVNKRLGVSDAPVQAQSEEPSIGLRRMGASGPEPAAQSAPSAQYTPSYGGPSTATAAPPYPNRQIPTVLETAPSGLNWGAFFIPFWWSIGHSAWVWTVISFFVHPIAQIVLLFSGNNVACQSRSFTGESQFRAVQRAWAIWGAVIFVIYMIPGIIVVPGLVSVYKRSYDAARAQAGQGGQAGVANPFAGMGGMMKITPGSGKIASVSPYTGAQQEGGTSSGSDEDGSFSSSTYTASAGIDKIIEFYKGVGHQAGSYSSSSSGDSGDATIATAGGLAKVHMESKGANQTSITIKTYGK